MLWAEAWARFRETPFLTLGADSRADWIANGVLYAPLGALGTLVLRRAVAAPLAGLGAWLGAAALALAVEFAQVAFPPRTVSLNDLLAEGIGAAIGVVGAWAFSSWLRDTALAWTRDVPKLFGRVLAAYAPVYVLYGLFPFDVLFTREEWSQKLASPAWGWLWAPVEGRTISVQLFLSLAEVVTAMPVGMAVVSHRRGARNAWRGAWAGAAIGATIELGQLALYSGVSQGASVLARALGAALGAAWFGGAVDGLGLERLRRAVARHAVWLGLAWLVALPSASGWFRHDWAGADQARRAWAELQLTPFYYHYYTTEAIALSSLARLAVLFAPLGLLAWARRVNMGVAVAIAALLAAALEAGKLFQPTTHADPTNVLIAAAAAALTVRLLRLVESLQARSRVQPSPPRATTAETAASTPASAEPPPQTTMRLRSASPRWGAALAAMAVALAITSTWPAPRWTLLVALAVALGAVLVRPRLALALPPLAMPVLDVAPWSGRFLVDEFDLLCAGVLSIAWLRTRGVLHHPPVPARLSAPARASVTLFAVSLALSVVHGWLGVAGGDVGAASHLHSPLNGLREAKGAVWALLFAMLYRGQLASDPGASASWRWGLAGGLALTAAVIVWERAAFVGLVDFGADHRVNGLFSAMSRGGAYVECFVAVAASVLLAGWPRGRAAAAAAGVLFLAAVYALLVTYSRNGYAALAAGASVALVHLWRSRGGARGARRAAGAAIVLGAVLAAAVLGGGFARERLARSGGDLAVRAAHWRVALAMRDDSLLIHLLGVGPGRFAERHLWSAHDEARAAPYAIVREDGNAFLRLGTGATVYIEQIVAPPPGTPLQLSADLRSTTPDRTLQVSLCRKWTLTSQSCRDAQLTTGPSAGRWQSQRIDLPALPPPPSFAASWLPIKLSFSTPVTGPAIDVDNVALAQSAGTRLGLGGGGLVANGGFDDAMDHWFFATDVDPPWHIHSLPVAVLFDQGWLGVLAWSALIAAAVVGGVRALRAGSPEGAAALAGLVAFVTSGLLNTLVDEPRFLWLLLVLCALCMTHGARATARSRATTRTAPNVAVSRSAPP